MKKTCSILFLVLSATACGGNGPAAPAAVSPVETAQGAATAAGRVVSSIFGVVSDTGYRALNGAIVTVVDGPQAGTSTTADANGQFTLAGRFDRNTTFRAAKEGYVTAAQTWSCSGGADCQATAAPWLGFYLAPVSSPPVDVAGRYTLTFSADSACTDLPDEVRTRTYVASIAPSSSPNVPAGTSFAATVTGASFARGLDNFTVGVSGDYVDLWLHGGHDPALMEQLGPNTYLAISGNAAAAAGSAPLSNLSMPFDGWIEYSCAPGAGHACEGAVLRRCESSHHRLVLTRQ